MYIKVKNAMTGDTSMITVSKLTSVSEVKDMVKEKMKVGAELQRLFFQGKQLENDYSLFDYNVKVNDIIQLMIRQPLGESQVDNIPKKTPSKDDKKEELVEEEKPEVKEVADAESELYKVGEKVDCRDEDTGAWFESKIDRITVNDTVSGSDFLAYHVKYEGYEDDMEPLKLKVELMRPRAQTFLKFVDLDLKQEIFVNYNIENPKERGFWYDAKVTGWKCTSTNKSLVVTLQGPGRGETKDCSIVFIEEVMKAEPARKVTRAVVDISGGDSGAAAPAGDGKCGGCGDKPARKCRECGCRKCGGKEDANNQILCDECDAAYHLKCLGMTSLPTEDEWFCPECKNEDNIVGGKVKMGKKKAGPGTGDSKRDWGQGFATVGRTKECNKVDKNHFGPIPGIEVGMSWLFRVQISEEGLHRPPVAGIAGSAKVGCPSLVLAGGYEDDVDNGDEFTYTGSGGRDLSGNKRTAEQSSDQKLERTNAAIAKNCKASFDFKNGGDAGDRWKDGKPIRVVRNYKGQKHSKYAPEEGNRYDGIYKVVKYYPEKGQSGFIVWRYLLRRDDPSPAPWTEEGMKTIEEEGFTLNYPDGYLEAQAEKEKEGKTPAKGKKRKKGESVEDEEVDDFLNDEEEEENASPAVKKAKTVVYKISKEWEDLMAQDKANANLWEQVRSKGVANKKELTDYVEDIFCCIICQDIVFKPVTTPCSHNVCLPCLERSFSADVFNCSSCRADLGKDYLTTKPLNNNLKKALNTIFPGYEVGR
eukprot:TRINITY_DN16464_c0_g1_i4.p1 TRINITY_DN16464_c0_g1~~TRINITY_DN16464_c0_g1_i4.p1  ORF type:complete len:757 (-),score=288.61 TRINITY_DN16464_c0_g1_i4:194-2464(-)